MSLIIHVHVHVCTHSNYCCDLVTISAIHVYMYMYTFMLLQKTEHFDLPVQSGDFS